MFDLQNYSTQNIKNDILSGALVAVALVPEAIAFSFIAGVSPVVGLYGAFIIGLITALIVITSYSIHYTKLYDYPSFSLFGNIGYNTNNATRSWISGSDALGIVAGPSFSWNIFQYDRIKTPDSSDR